MCRKARDPADICLSPWRVRPEKGSPGMVIIGCVEENRGTEEKIKEKVKCAVRLRRARCAHVFWACILPVSTVQLSEF